MDISFQSTREINHTDDKLVDNYFKLPISFSHITGMITSILVDYIKSAFPDNFFKTTWNSLEVPFAQRSAQFKDVLSKPKPSLLIEPRFDPSDEASFRPSSEFDGEVANNPKDNIKILTFNSGKLIKDTSYELYYTLRRYKMTFNTNFLFNSMQDRIQYQEYIRQNIRHRAPIVYNTYLSNIIPEPYMKVIASLVNMEYDSDEFITYLNNYSLFPITHRLRTGSGNNEFFAMMRSPIEIRFTDIPTGNDVRKGNLITTSAFSDAVYVEFTAYSSMILKTSTELGKPLHPMENINVDTDHSQSVGVDKIFLYEIPEIPEFAQDYIKYKTVTIQADKSGDDVLDLHMMINRDKELLQIIDTYNINNKKIDFFNFLIFEDSNILNGNRCTFDNDTLKLTISNMDIYKMYYITLYVNKNKLANVRQEIFEIEKYKKKG